MKTKLQTMNPIDIKRYELIQYAMQVNSLEVLEKALEFFASNEAVKQTDWWDDLSNEEQDEIKAGLTDYENGNFVSHSEAKEEIKQYIKSKRK